MTIEEYLKAHMVSNGLFPQQAEAVINTLKNVPENQHMQTRWRDDIQGYPKSFMAVMLTMCDHEVVKWMDKDAPLHWARPMFAPTQPNEQEKTPTA